MRLRVILASMLMVVCSSMARGQTKYPPETRNAALRYWMAFAEMQDPPADKATQELLEKTAVGTADWNEAKLGPILDANGEAIRTMQRASSLPGCDWGLEYNRGARAAIPYVPRARVMARLNELDGVREMARGNSQDAVDAWLAGIRFSKHLANGGPLIFALVAKSALLPDLRVLAAEIGRGHLSETERKQISVVLNGMREDAFDWGAAWGLEELTVEQTLGEVRTAANPGAAYEAVMGEPLPAGADIPSAKDVDEFREYMMGARQALTSAPEAASARLVTLDGEERALPLAIRKMIPSAGRVNDARLEVVAARSELAAALAAK